MVTTVFFIFMKNKNIFKNIGIAFISALLGAALMFFFKPKEKPQTIRETIEQIKYIDTCLSEVRIDTFYLQPEIKKGTAHTRTDKPRVEEVKVKDSTYYKTYHKSYNEGLLRASVDITVKSIDPSVDIEDFKFTYEVDTLLAKEIFKETQTIILQPSITETTKFIPTESTKRFIKAVAGLGYDDELYYKAGATMELKPLEISVLKNIKRQGAEIQLSVPIIPYKK